MAEKWMFPAFRKAREEQARLDRDKKTNGEIPRFFVMVPDERNPNTTRHIIFLDDFRWKTSDGIQMPVAIYEHALEINKNWRAPLFQTCIKEMGQTCILCENGFQAFYRGILTILDITPWKNREGELVITPTRKFMVCPHDIILMLQDKASTRGGTLQGWLFKVNRYKHNSPRVGSDFDAVKHIDDIAAYLQEKGWWPDTGLDLGPYRYDADAALRFYNEHFAPKSQDVIKRLLTSGATIRDLYSKRKDMDTKIETKSEVPKISNNVDDIFEAPDTAAKDATETIEY